MPGPSFWFLVIVAAMTVGTAVRFAFRPAERTLALVRPLCAASVFAGLAAFFMGVTNGLTGFHRALASTTDPMIRANSETIFLGGLAESAAPLVVACAGVTVAWLLVAVGLRRLA
jgi:hypothetical protein